MGSSQSNLHPIDKEDLNVIQLELMEKGFGESFNDSRTIYITCLTCNVKIYNINEPETVKKVSLSKCFNCNSKNTMCINID